MTAWFFFGLDTVAPDPNGGSEVSYNAKMISEELSKGDNGSVTIPAPFLNGPTDPDRVTVPHDSWGDVPQLDLAEAETDEAGLAKKLVDALTNWGFFTLRNHGILEELIEEVQAEGHKFFNLPVEVKRKVGLAKLLTGYIGDYQASDLRRLLWTEGLMMNIRSTQPEDFASTVWPKGASTFSASIRKYCRAVKRVQILMLELLAVGLDLDKDYFAKHFDHDAPARDQFRWSYYPPCPKPLDVIGIVPHTDSVVLTILHDGEVGGLQFERNGEWRGIKPAKGALVCNSGEFLKVWTNDKLKSPLHRVVVNEAKTRLSTAVFLNPPDSTLVSAPSSLAEDIGQERKYKDFLIADFFNGIVEQIAAGKYPRGSEFIADTLEINTTSTGKWTPRVVSATA